jgi:7-cyano-7-deazaguanine synthase
MVECLNFSYGSKHNAREREAAKKICEILNTRLREIDLDFNGMGFKSALLAEGPEIPDGHYADDTMKQTVVPFRNGIMGSIAAGLAESISFDAISLAVHAGDHTIYPDCRPVFFEGFCQAVSYGTWKEIKVLTPFIIGSKITIVKEGAALHVPMHLSWTCYKGREKHCGICGSCTERKEAFEKAGINDLTEYEV